MPIHLSLAPFQGITGKEYRLAFIRHFPGLDAVYAPFISGVHPEKPNPSKFVDVLPKPTYLVESVPQFVSVDSKEIITIARFLHSHGYQHVNWNMGCPFSRLANKMRGCGILPFPDEIRRLMDEAMSVLPLKLSVKCRLGYHNTQEILSVLEVFNEYPLHKVIIHPRTGQQLYKGDVHLEAFADCLKVSRHPIAYNGDIYHSDKYTTLSKRFPEIQNWMVGRGALINPFLFADIKNIVLDDTRKRELLNNFHHDLLEGLSLKIAHQSRLLGQLKAVWYYMSGIFSGGKEHFESMKVCVDKDSYLTFVDQLLRLPFASNEEIESYWKNGLKHI